MTHRSLFIVISVSLLGLQAMGQEENIDTRSLLKLNLSDWYWARYELGYEHVLNESTSVQFALAGIAAEEPQTNNRANNLLGTFTGTDINLEHGGGGSHRRSGGMPGCMAACRRGVFVTFSAAWKIGPSP